MKPPSGGPGATPVPQPAPNNPSIPWEGFNFQMNALEQLTTITPALQALTQKNYYDMTDNIKTPQIRLDRVSNEQELNDIKASGNLAVKEAYANSPSGRAGAIAANVRARSLKNIAESNSRNNNINTQINNQEDMTNYQASVGDLRFNTQAKHQSFNNNQLVQQRADSDRRNGFNQSLNNANAIQTNLDTLSFAATAQAMPFVTNAKDENGNEILVPGKDGRNYTVQGVPFGYNNRRMPQFNPAFGSLDSFGVQMQRANGAGQNQALQDALNQAIMNRDVDAVTAYSKALYALNQSSRGSGNTALQNIASSQYNFQRNGK